MEGISLPNFIGLGCLDQILRGLVENTPPPQDLYSLKKPSSYRVKVPWWLYSTKFSESNSRCFHIFRLQLLSSHMVFSKSKAIAKIEKLQERLFRFVNNSDYSVLLSQSGQFTMEVKRMRYLCIEI